MTPAKSFLLRKKMEIASWLRAVFHRSRLEDEMEAELADHIERLTADLVRAGHSSKDAARRARVALGPALKHKEAMRESLGLRWWDELAADLRFAVRILRKSPGFTAIAGVSLALAIGANTAIFSVAKNMLYDRLAVPHPEQLRALKWHAVGDMAVHSMWGDFDPAPEGGMSGTIFSYPVYLELRAHNQSLQDLFAFKWDGMNATAGGVAQRVETEMVSGNYYSVLGVRPQLGRPIQPSDESEYGAGTVAVISEGLWERAYGRSPSVLGRTITVNQTPFTIVGVNPRGFTGAKGVQASPDVFVPLTMQPVIDPKGTTSLLDDPTTWWVNVAGRAKPGVKDSQAQAVLAAQLDSATRGTMQVKPSETLPHLVLADGSRGLRVANQMFKKPAYVLMALTGFVLLLACANIANLMLARGAQRQREMSVRLALGAGRGRILRQLLTESLLLATIGGVGGLVLGYLGRNAIPGLLTTPWAARAFEVHFDWGVFAFSAAVTIVTGMLFGLAPAWLAARSEVSSSLKENAQTATRSRNNFGGKTIVVFQIALSTLLVVGAGLFLRTLFALDSIDVGFRTDHLILFEIAPPALRYAKGKDVQLHQRLEQAFAALPGVESVAPSWTAYIADGMANRYFLPEGEADKGDHSGAEDVNVTGDTFFQAMEIPIVSGRGFGVEDTPNSMKVAVINQALAKKRFPNTNPVGKRFKTDDERHETDGEKHEWVTIVGVCGDTRYATLRDPAPAQFFMPYVQQPAVGSMTYAIRTSLSPGQLAPALRRVVEQEDRDLPVIDIRTQREQIDATLEVERIFATLTSGFGLLALALACVGIYGIMAYTVAQRTNEIGIRLALGAQPGQVRGMIFGESSWLAVAGIIAGTGAALGLTRLVKSMLYGIQPWDPATIMGGVLILLAVALAASWIPARRAASVQPMEALRHE